MNDLLNLQVEFKNTLLTGSNHVSAYLNHTHTAQLHNAIAIYKNAYQLRLIDTLKSDYPVLAILLGTDAFNELALAYITEYPSNSFTLRTFGQHVSQFLAQDAAYQSRTYLAEMANFEWQLTDIFDIADSTLATVDDMSHYPPEDWAQLSIKYHSSVRWIELHWNITELYQALLSNSTVPALTYSTTQQHCLLWRKHYSSHFRLVEAREYFAMQTLARFNFAELCLTLSALDQCQENAALQAATYLKTWLSTDLIESIYLSDQGMPL